MILNLVPGILTVSNEPGTISYRHPDYEIRWWWREFYRISYLGGREYLKPMRLTVDFQEPVIVTRTADGQLPGDISGQSPYMVNDSIIRSVLFRHNREKSWEYENRRKRAHYINFVQPITKSLVSHATKKQAIREGSDAMMEFWDGVDCERDQGIGDFMKDGLRWAQIMGLMWACVDKQAPSADDPDADGKPYVYWVNPLDIFDWSVDDDGDIEWLKQFVYTEQKRTWRDKITPVYRFRVWDKENVETFEVQTLGGANEKSLGKRKHGLGRVPFEPLFSQRDKESLFPDGIPIMADACKLSNSVFNYSSLKDEIAYKQTFSWLAIPDKNVDTVQIGLNTAFGYDPMHTSAVPTYVSPDHNQARVLMDMIQNGLEQLRQMLGVGRGRMEGSMQKSSADALELENEDKRSILSDIAGEAQDFEYRLAALVSQYNAEDPETTNPPLRIVYSGDYDLRTFTDEVSEYLSFASIGLSPEVELRSKQDLVRKRFGDLPPDQIEALVESMKAKQEADQAMTEQMQQRQQKALDNAGTEGQPVPGMGNPRQPNGQQGDPVANRPPNVGPRQPQPPKNAGAATGAAEPGTRY